MSAGARLLSQQSESQSDSDSAESTNKESLRLSLSNSDKVFGVMEIRKDKILTEIDESDPPIPA